MSAEIPLHALSEEHQAIHGTAAVRRSRRQIDLEPSRGATISQGHHAGEIRIAGGRRASVVGAIHHLEQPLKELAVDLEQARDETVLPVDGSGGFTDGQGEHLKLQIQPHSDELALGGTAAHQAVEGGNHAGLRRARRVERPGLEALLQIGQQVHGKHWTPPLKIK
jgi:hypothetical protein